MGDSHGERGLSRGGINALGTVERASNNDRLAVDRF